MVSPSASQPGRVLEKKIVNEGLVQRTERVFTEDGFTIYSVLRGDPCLE